MKNHTKTARAHFVIAALYAVPLIGLLVIAPRVVGEPDWQPAGFVAALVFGHALMGWGAWRAKNWARVLTLALAFPALLAVPLGTLLAILLISYCWPAWDGRIAALTLPRPPTAAK